LVIFVFYDRLFNKGGSNSDVDKAARREAAKATVAGEFLKSKAGGKKTILLCADGTQTNVQGKAFIEALNKSFGSVKVVELKPANPEGDTGISKKDVETALDQNKDAELIIFYGTTPEGFEFGDKLYFLFDTGSCDLAVIKKGIDDGKVLGIVLTQQNLKVKHSDPVEKDPKEAFKKRYILIDKGNIGSNAAYFPGAQ